MFFNDVFFLLEMVSFNPGAVWFWGEIILPNLLQFFEARCAPQRHVRVGNGGEIDYYEADPK